MQGATLKTLKTIPCYLSVTSIEHYYFLGCDTE